MKSSPSDSIINYLHYLTRLSAGNFPLAINTTIKRSRVAARPKFVKCTSCKEAVWTRTWRFVHLATWGIYCFRFWSLEIFRWLAPRSLFSEDGKRKNTTAIFTLVAKIVVNQVPTSVPCIQGKNAENCIIVLLAQKIAVTLLSASRDISEWFQVLWTTQLQETDDCNFTMPRNSFPHGVH